MEGYSHLAGLLQSTWDASQSYLGQGVHLSSIHSAALEVLRTEAVQYVVSFFPRTHIGDLNLCRSAVFADTLVFPGYAAGASLLVLFGQLLLQSEGAKWLYEKLTRSRDDLDEDEDVVEEVEAEDTGTLEQEHSYVVTRYTARYGGVVIFAFRVFRLLCTLALLSLSIVTAVLAARSKNASLATAVVPHVVLCLTYVSSPYHLAV